ncbi:30S ribosomal protein S14 [Aerococcaceae bacterium DSM 111020]|nr:30S ribosomal protein S14 [Aerococcaceae bacterium DSM 111020]
MAKKSKIAKYQKQIALVEQYATIRQELKKNKDYQALAQLPKDSHPNRLRYRDRLDGRPRGYMRQFGLSRVNFRRLALQGLIPGVKKSSW